MGDIPGRATRLACMAIALCFLALPATGALHSFSVPGQPLNFNPPGEIASILLKIDEGLLGRHISDLQDFGTRYAYRGDKCFQAADHIGSVFRRNGLGVYYDDFIFSNTFNDGMNVRANMRNVIGVKPGISASNGTVIICGHYDSITPGSYPWTEAPGADDNGSGIAAIMAAAEILSDYDFNLTIKFIAFSGEELGLLGSYSYVNGAVAAGENITAVINLDMIAFNPDPGATTVNMFEGSNGNSSWLKSFVSDTAARYAHITGMEPIDSGRNSRSDHQPFSARYQAIMFIEQNYAANPNYHRVTDTLDYLNLTYCANVTQLAVAAVSELAGLCTADTRPPVASRAVPANDTHATALPAISLELTDPAGIDVSSLLMKVDGAPVIPLVEPVPLGVRVSHVPASPFPDGEKVNVSVQASDNLGNAMNHSWSFLVDAVPPEPPSNFTIAATAIRPVKQGTVVDIGAPWDLKHALAPSVIYRNGEYKMWYTASNSTNKFHICYANSTDGINWAKHGIVLLYTVAGQPDYYQVGYPEVIFDGEYKMWYSGYNATVWQIMYANSTDGTNWTRHGVVLGLGSQGSLDSVYSMAASVLKMGEYRMWYTGYDGLKFSILYANSSDGITWTRHSTPSISPEGPGSRWGDAGISYPSVILDDGIYRMWYNRIGDNYFRTHHATSRDGISWDDQGLVLEAGQEFGTDDRFQATHCSVLQGPEETMIWYSGFNSNNWRIMFANITAHERKSDILLSWSPSPDVVAYEIFRESRPSAFTHLPESGTRARPKPPAGVTPWAFETESVDNATVYGPAAGSDPPFFSLPDDNIIDITLCIRSGSGSWVKLAAGTDYALDQARGIVEISSPHFTTGCTVHAWYNHSAGRALRVTGTSVTDVGAGASPLSYYYIIRAVDRAGNTAECGEMVGKIGNEVGASWNLLGNPLLEGPVPLSEALAGLDWVAARTWDPEKFPNHWTSNITGRPYELNTLQTVDNSTGIWVKTASAGVHSSHGIVANISMTLKAGWNLVSYPYHEYMSVSQALAGIPWDRVEAMDAASPYLLRVLDNNSMLRPGQGLWVRVTSDAVWHAINLP